MKFYRSFTHTSALATLAVLFAVIAVACGSSSSGEPDSTPKIATSTPATPTPTAPTPTATTQGPPPVTAALSDAAPPTLVPELPGGASGFTHFVFERVGDQVITSLVEGPRGEQVRQALSFPALQDLYASDAALPEALPMTREELGRLVEELGTIRDATARYSDIAVALADGYVQTTNVVPNMGAHFNHLGRTVDGRFVLSEPEILIYDLDPDGAWRLIGVSFVLPYQFVGDTHPSGFTGPLDNWHMHYALCTGGSANTASAAAHEDHEDDDGFIDAGTTDRAGCEAAGGTFTDKYGWMIHAWVRDDNPLGVFSMWNSNVPPLADAASIRATRDQIAEEDETIVTIENFELGSITVDAGQYVTWLNADGVPHTVTQTSGADAFDSDLIGPGQSYAFQFTAPGTYALTCRIHPSMNGTVIVE